MYEYGPVPLRGTTREEPRTPARRAGAVRRTAVHQGVLNAVLDGRVEWRTTVGPSGGFVRRDGLPFEPSDELVALYELRNAALLVVDIHLGRVSITSAGLARLAQWNAWQRGKAS